MPTRSRVLIAGGGVGGLEAALGLQALIRERVELVMLAPERHFTYRPLAVGQPFGLGVTARLELSAIAKDRGFALIPDALDSVEADQRKVVTRDGAMLRYDRLILALGAQPQSAVTGALTFRGPQDAMRISLALATSAGSSGHVVFAAPHASAWTLPAYELALLTAHWASRRAPRLRISLVTAEPAPLAAFGAQTSAKIGAVLRAADISVHCNRAACAFARGRLRLADGDPLSATAVVALPRLTGPAISGLPQDGDGFVPVDDRGRVLGEDGAYAVGDMTTHPMRQGGLATQQADAVAHSIAFAEGADVEPRPYRPQLDGMLLTGDTPLYLRADRDPTEAPAAFWWPAHKIVSRYLGPYLASNVLAGAAPRPTTTAART
jgi:sulfide:quinone oxidoreductase